MPPDVLVLTPEAVPHLRLPWDGRFTSEELRHIAATEPVLSVWNRRTGEYVVGGDWRHREEIISVVDLAATSGAIDLMHGLAALGHARGKQLLVASEQAERRRREFFHSAGMSELERIVVYELPRIKPGSIRDSVLAFERLRREDAFSVAELQDLDHKAFPWLWWNNEREFSQYRGIDGVAVDVAREENGRMVAYVGTTRFRGWGHLDRIAVAPEHQGRGLGRAALDYAVMSLATAGAKRVGLSTQARNERSRRLYEAYGFHRTPSHDYSVFGRWLDQSSRVG
jgi:ribosomal-protein-alanine N-acetyltransferase